LHVRLPRAAEIVVLRDGARLHRAHGAAVDVGLELPGVYRVEARIDGRLWLLSNPIHLRPAPMEPACAPSASASLPTPT
jgi:hypothetical protein